MRRADLRVYDVRMITSILGVFCALSVFFFLVLWEKYLLPQQLPIKTFLWSSYGLIMLLAGGVYFSTKKTPYEWVRMVGAADMIGKGKYPIERKMSYLVHEEDKANDIAVDALTYKVPCMYVTRTNPDIIRQKMAKLVDATIIWLTELNAKNTVNPLEMEEISYTLQKYLEKTGPAVIFFDGLGYMLNALPFQRVLFFLQDIRDHISVKEGVLVLLLDLTLLDSTKQKLLEREFKIL